MEKLLYTLANGGIPQEEKQLKMCDLLNREFISGKLIKWVIKNHTPIGFLKLSNDKEYPKIEEIESPDYGEYGRLLINKKEVQLVISADYFFDCSQGTLHKLEISKVIRIPLYITRDGSKQDYCDEQFKLVTMEDIEWINEILRLEMKKGSKLPEEFVASFNVS